MSPGAVNETGVEDIEAGAGAGNNGAETALTALTLTLETAREYLGQIVMPVGFSQVQSYLLTLKNRANFLMLYQHYFPQEFGRSTASITIPPARALSYSTYANKKRGAGTGTTARAGAGATIYSWEQLAARRHSARELEFLELVEDRLFCYQRDWLVENEDEEGWEDNDPMDVIYLPQLGLDWWETYIEDLKVGWQILLKLNGSISSDYTLNASHNFGVEKCQIYQALLDKVRPEEVVLSRLKAEIGKSPTPLRFLMTAFAVIDHETGNAYLDPTPDWEMEPLDWCVEDMDFLTREFKEFKEIDEKMEQLLNWLEASPYNLKELVLLWNRCTQMEEEEEGNKETEAGAQTTPAILSPVQRVEQAICQLLPEPTQLTFDW